MVVFFPLMLSEREYVWVISQDTYKHAFRVLFGSPAFLPGVALPGLRSRNVSEGLTWREHQRVPPAARSTTASKRR